MTPLDWLRLLGQLPWFGWLELSINSLLRFFEVVFVWSVAVVAVAFMFRRTLRDLIDSLVHVKFHDTEIELRRNWQNVEASGEAVTSEQAVSPEAQPTPPATAGKSTTTGTTDLESALLEPLPTVRKYRRYPQVAQRIEAIRWLNTSDEDPPEAVA